MAFHLIAALRDEESDKSAGMKTTATWLGRTGTLVLSAILIAVTLFFTLPLDSLLLSSLLIVQLIYLIVLGSRYPKGFLYIFVLSCCGYYGLSFFGDLVMGWL